MPSLHQVSALQPPFLPFASFRFANLTISPSPRVQNVYKMTFIFSEYLVAVFRLISSLEELGSTTGRSIIRFEIEPCTFRFLTMLLKGRVVILKLHSTQRPRYRRWGIPQIPSETLRTKAKQRQKHEWDKKQYRNRRTGERNGGSDNRNDEKRQRRQKQHSRENYKCVKLGPHPKAGLQGKCIMERKERW